MIRREKRQGAMIKCHKKKRKSEKGTVAFTCAPHFEKEEPMRKSDGRLTTKHQDPYIYIYIYFFPFTFHNDSPSLSLSPFCFLFPSFLFPTFTCGYSTMLIMPTQASLLSHMERNIFF